VEFARAASFFKNRAWWKLVPDTSAAHSLVTAGYGTYGASTDGVTTTSYVQAAVASDGSWGCAYLPAAATVTVDCTKLSGTFTAKWYDPTNDSYSTIGTHANTGTQNYTLSGNNSAGDPDRVLLLEVP
jgi:hypothetical protein